jgi:predicted metal-dependent hydrolase
MWRWHCEEEIAHSHVTLDLMQACRVPGWQRLGFYLVATLGMAGDLVRDMRVFHRVDRDRSGRPVAGFWPSLLGFAVRGMGAGRLLREWLGYFKPLRHLPRPASATPQPAPVDRLP